MSMTGPPSEKGAVVVLIEDEKQIRRFVRQALESAGLAVHEAVNVDAGLIEAGTRQPDLVILDLGLPGRDGLEFIREFRAWSQMPILVLSARNEEATKIAALDAGADDYLTKPFGIGELLARVRAGLRRRARLGGSGPTKVELGELSVDFLARQVLREGQPVHLTPIEYRLLAHLLANAGKVLTHRQILREVWGPGYTESSHTLRVHMSQLRRKLEKDPARPQHLLTEIAVGYRLSLEPVWKFGDRDP